MLRKSFLTLLTFVLFLNASNVFAAFADVSSEDPYFYDIVRLQNAGFIQGDENGHFNPDQGINRCEMAKLTEGIYKSFVPKSFIIDYTVPLDVFPDIPHEHWCNEKASFLKNFEMAYGDEQGNFNPWREVSIAESLLMIIAAHPSFIINNELPVIGETSWDTFFLGYMKSHNLEDEAFLNSVRPNDVASRKTVARMITRMIDQNESENTDFERFRWEVDMYGDLGPRYDYLGITFSYPKKYILEETDGDLQFYQTKSDGSRGEKVFTFEYLGGSALDTVRVADCGKTGNVPIGVHVFTRFECNTGVEEDYQFHYYGYHIQIGEQYFHATNNLNDTQLQDFEGILHSMKWVIH